MRDRGVLLETFGGRRFRIGSDVLDIPDFENADVFVDRLVRKAIVEENDLVASVIDGRPKAMSERTLQRHFLRTTGLTFKRFTLIRRAERAVALLRTGRPAVDVAFDLGYADQAHLINSLRAIMGRTPSQIARSAAP
jgi:methylphosphotriester-DNA--protein-cysteine methyltransferase